MKEHMLYCNVAEGTRLYSHDDYGTCFFIVERGRLEMASAGGDRVKVLRANDGNSITR